MYSAPYVPPPGSATETESIISADDDDYDDNTFEGYEGHFPDRAKGGRLGRLNSGPASTSGTATPTQPQPQPYPTGPGLSANQQGKARAPSLGLRSATAFPPGRSGSRFRSLSKARRLSDDDEFGPVDRPMSPIPGRRKDDREDDEVERLDRGEELVRKRMRDRARLKKEQNRLSRAVQGERDPTRRSSYNPTQPDFDPFDATDRQFSTSSAPIAPGVRSGSKPPNVRSVSRTGRAELDERAITPVSASPLTPGPPGGGLWNTKSPGFPRPMSRAASTRPDDDEGGYFSASNAGDGTAESVADTADDADSGDENLEDEVREGEEEDEEEDDEDDDSEELNRGEVEYTLKDRQDAINVEHPFGLPIWKPALYKKSRSVARNAEAALHASPESTGARHLSVGNVLWTVFFGSWLFVVCAVVSGGLWCVPWGGGKYGRVVWELGGYLFWPFGKYVEGWTDGPDGEDEQDEDEDDDYDSTEDESVVSHSIGADDVEQAGTTYRSPASTVRGSILGPSVFNSNTPASLPDEPARRSSARSALPPVGERSRLVSGASAGGYGTNATPTIPEEGKAHPPRSSSEETVGRSRPHDFSKDGDGQHGFRVRALGRVMFWVGFYLVVAPLMVLACMLCWGLVFTIPMAKLLWVLLRHLHNEPLSLHFRSPPKYISPPVSGSGSTDTAVDGGVQYPLRAGQRAPPVSRKSVAQAKAQGRLFGPHSTVLLCTYKAAGSQYVKYTVDGVNIIFINLLSLVLFTILDFFFLVPYVEHRELGGVFGMLANEAFVFLLALLSVIPLSYFIGMAVASISAQSSIGMGAVINATFGSIIEVILYGLALTQGKSELVEGSIVGSILAGVLLMPGMSMIGGALRRKEQRFNAKSAGVTSTMLIMAIIGILTPTLFYEIYGSFQLSCTECDPSETRSTESCRTCYYEHVNPAEDPFYATTVRWLSYWCATILVLSYLIGLWFSLKTHASQIWQNAQPTQELARPSMAALPGHPTGAADRAAAVYKRMTMPPLNRYNSATAVTPLTTPALGARGFSAKHDLAGPASELGVPVDELVRAFHLNPPRPPSVASRSHSRPPTSERRQPSHAREHSGPGVPAQAQAGAPAKTEAGEEAHGGHDAPNWSRTKSASVLMGCTVLYAIIAEILVDVVDVVLDGSGIPEKFLGVTLFALVPNTTEFMNAISFAINGNIALSMEIGSAYALQVCLIQAPVMLLFSAVYATTHGGIVASRYFTLVFPRWDVIAIMFSVFLLTYTYIEARSNYYRGSILCLAYLVLLGGFAFAPPGVDTANDPLFWGNAVSEGAASAGLTVAEGVRAVLWALFTR